MNTEISDIQNSIIDEQLTSFDDIQNKIKGSKKKVFDPRLVDDKGTQTVWTSESIELAVNGLNSGYKLVENPFQKNVRGYNLRKSNLPFQYTEDELWAIEYCMDDKIFFANNFCKLKDGNKGWVNIKTYDYQEEILNKYTNNRWNILKIGRQMGKTTTTILEIVHYACFNFDKQIVVIAQTEKVVNEILDKIKEVFAGLPWFLQPGFKNFNKKGFSLDNGTKLIIGIANESIVQGFSVDFLFIDEFAYIKEKVVTKFWNNIYPSLAKNDQSRCVIASTPNGRNKFYELVEGALNKTNKFIYTEVEWYRCPGRDEKFKEDTIANVGLESWLMSYECSFDTQISSILNIDKQKELRQIQKDYKFYWSTSNSQLNNEFDNFMFIDEKHYQYSLKNDYFIFALDISEGLGLDYSVIKIVKIDWCINKKCLIFVTIGIFRNNNISIKDLAKLFILLTTYFDKSNIKAIVETNNYGGEFFAHIDTLIAYNTKYSDFNSKSIFTKTYRKSKNNFERGIRWDPFNKNVAVKSFINSINKKIIIETNSLAIEEILNVSKKENGSYSAKYGNDDMFMCDVLLSHFLQDDNPESTEWLQNIIPILRNKYNDYSTKMLALKKFDEFKQKNEFNYNDWKVKNYKDKKYLNHVNSTPLMI